VALANARLASSLGYRKFGSWDIKVLNIRCLAVYV
jgi:hypothetical protein